MGCQQGRDKQQQSCQNKKVFQSPNINPLSPSLASTIMGLDNLENIRNNEDLAKVIVKKLVLRNELKLSSKLRKQSEDLVDQGNFAEALNIQKQVLSLQRQNQNQKSTQDLAQCLFKIGDLLIKMENYEECFAYFREILDLDKFPNQKEMHTKTLRLLNKAAEELLLQGKLEQALLQKKEVLNYTIYFFGENNENYEERINTLRTEIGQYEELYKQIIQLQINKEFVDPEFFDDQENECMICCKELVFDKNLKNVQELEKINITRLRCNHIFHSNCINQWFIKKPNCPYCRSDLYEEEYLDEEEEFEQIVGSDSTQQAFSL